MTDDELRTIIGEIDLALEILRKNRGDDFDPGDVKLRTMLADLRRELAVYRALAQTGDKRLN